MKPLMTPNLVRRWLSSRAGVASPERGTLKLTAYRPEIQRAKDVEVRVFGGELENPTRIARALLGHSG